MAILKQTIVEYQAVYGSTKTNNSRIPGCIWQYKTNNNEIAGCIWQY